MITILDACLEPPIPPNLIETILEPLLPSKKTEAPDSYEFVCKLIGQAIPRMGPSIAKFFVEENKSELQDSYHEILSELNQISPLLILSTLPRLEDDLKLEETVVRKKATELLSKIFRSDHSIIVSQRALYTIFLGRFTDKNEEVRKELVDYAYKAISTSPEQKQLYSMTFNIIANFD